MKDRLVKVVFVGLLVCVFAVIGLSVSSIRRSLLLKQVHNDLKWIGMALHDYHDQHGHFPPVVTHDPETKLDHSWRTVIQKDLARQATTTDDFGSYDFRQSWDSLHNTESASKHRFGSYPYRILAIVGPHAAWGHDRPRQLADFKDGTSHSILVLGIPGTGFSWNAPSDAHFDGQTLSIRGTPIDPSVPLFALMADGSVRYGVTVGTMTPHLTIDTGDSAPEM